MDTPISIRPRPELEHISPVPHGGFNSTQAGKRLLDFSANVNPFGPTSQAWDAIRSVDISRHPDPRASLVRAALADQTGLPIQQILVGNGSIDLIYQLVIAYVRPHDRVLIVEPTFGEYAAAASVMGAEIVSLHTHPQERFTINLDDLLSTVYRTKPRILFLCNPNNPTGTVIACDKIGYLLHKCSDTLVIVDESFIRFVNSAATTTSAVDLLNAGNLVILRSLTKDYALTGLRIGYMLAPASVVAALMKVQPPWSVNALAQAAALAALEDEEHLRASIEALLIAKERLVSDLTGLGASPLPSCVHFFLVPVHSAAECTQRLLTHNILVRDCTPFCLPTFVRISTRKPGENAYLVEVLAQTHDLLRPFDY